MIGRAWGIVIGVVMSAVAAGPARAGDWPMYGRDATRNPVSPEKSPPPDWQVETHDDAGRVTAPARNVKWKAALGSNTIGSPIVAGGLVWVCSNNEGRRDPGYDKDAGCLLCFNASDGAFRWQHLTPRHPNGRVNDWPGSSSASPPLVEGDRMWFLTNRWEVLCLDIGPLLGGAGEPREVWKLDLMRDLGVFGTSPVMAANIRCAIGAPYKGMIYVITGNGVEGTHTAMPAPDVPALLCLDKDTGRVVWKDNSPGDRVLDTQCSSPLVTEVNGRGLVIAPQGDGWVRAFDALTGKPVWQFDANPKAAVFPSTRNLLMAPPVLYEGRVYVATGQDMSHANGPGLLWCIDPAKTGEVSEELDDGPAPPRPGGPGPDAPTRKGGARRGRPNPESAVVWKFDRINGPGVKAREQDRMHRSAGTVAAAEGLVIAADMEGFVHCLDARTGRHFWGHDAESAVYGSPLICDGKVYVGTDDGTVEILALAKEEKLLARTDMGASILSSPVYANGVLYVETRQTLYAIPGGRGGASPATAPAATAPGAATDWPQWRGPDRTNVARDSGLLAQWPPVGPPLLWKAGGLGQGVPSVAVAGGRVYALGYLPVEGAPEGEKAEYLTARACADGRRLWRARVGPAVPEQPQMRWLSQRTPTADGDRVYAVTARGELVCFSAADGAERWRKDYKTDFGGRQNGWGYCDYPLVDGDRLICCPGGKDASMVALKKTSGELLWKCAVPGGERSTYSATVLAEVAGARQYVQQFDGGAAGVGTDGRLLWSYPGLRVQTTGNVHTALVRGDEVFLSAGWGTGDALIRIRRDGDAFAAEERYRLRNRDFDPWLGNSSVVGDHVYTNSGQCIEWETGTVAWREAQFRSRVTTAVADGRIYYRLGDGTVVLAEVNPEKYVERGRFQAPRASKEPAWTSPVIAGGRLYLRDQDELLCYDLRQDRTAAWEVAPTPAAHDAAPAATRPASTGATRPAGPGRRGLDAVFVPTPQDVVERMLEMAAVTKEDRVYDLGCGDGRIVVTAAKKYGCRAAGYDLDAECVRLSREAARREGVADRVGIERKDIFDLDLSGATVVTLYLGADVNRRLLPQLRRLPAGARVVSHQFGIEGCRPDQVVEFTSAEDGAKHTLYMWTAPVPAAGKG